MDGQHVLAKSLLCQTFFRLCRFYRVDIGRMDVSLPLQLLEHGFRVTSVAECGIKTGLSRFDLQEIKNFFYHNGDMHTCRGVAFLDDMRDGVFVFSGCSSLYFSSNFFGYFPL